MFYEAAISNEQLNVLKKLSESIKASDKFYLAGGTALALRLGHRRSYDFDFFTDEKFNSDLNGTTLETVKKYLLANEKKYQELFYKIL